LKTRRYTDRIVRPETINRRIRELRQLLEQAEPAIQPSPHQLASLGAIYHLAAAEMDIPGGCRWVHQDLPGISFPISRPPVA
jgi:hypothetical protein